LNTKEDRMPDRVKDWMSSPVVVVDADSSVSYALTLMRRRSIHSLVVVMGDEKPVYGILTTTDIRDKIIIAERNPAETRVREVMTSPVEIADPAWSLRECSLKMHATGIHHMPVADEHGLLVGMISVTDIFRAAEEIGWGREK
jgi:signal-transduction protein with cAMP-binding, CBS, and nucleotidyltransferase domain